MAILGSRESGARTGMAGLATRLACLQESKAVAMLSRGQTTTLSCF